MTADPNLAVVTPDATVRELLSALAAAPDTLPPSRRDLFAAAALVGLLASDGMRSALQPGVGMDQIARRAASWAESLEAAVDQTREGGA